VKTETVALVGALDTKGKEYAYVKECIEARGFSALLIDIGTGGPPVIEADISRQEVADAAEIDLAALMQRQDRGESIAAMSRGVAALVPRLYAEGRIQAIMALGGSGGTFVACAAMRSLPIGIPKIMVSTVAGEDVSGYVGATDIVMVPSIVDVAGINRISRGVFAKAAGAVCGMIETLVPDEDDKPLIAASMFGNTTQCVDQAKAILEQHGYEVLVFHATGTGGRTMESLIETGAIAGVLDITTTEWADELVGGVLTAGPSRLEAAAKHGVPAIVTPACLDMVNFWAPDTIPEQFQGRRFYQHNPNITLMRTSPEECVQLGRILAEKLNQSTGPVSVLIPLRGLSVIDAPDQPFWWPEADQALAAELESHLRSDIPVLKIDANVNDAAFAEACAATLLENLSIGSK
jgi:uncharacterized protein (UPF0261 family)